MADVNFYLKDPKSKEKTLIYLFFSFDGNRMKYSTGEFIKPSSWNSEKQRARFSTVGATDINNRLIKLDEDINKIYRNLILVNEDINGYILKRKLDECQSNKRKNKIDFFSFIEDHIIYVTPLRKKATIISYNNSLNVLKEYKEYIKRQVDFNTINLDFYYDYIDYLTNQRDFSKNTIGKHIKNIKAFLNEATEKGVNKNLDYKSNRFKVSSEDSDSIYLDKNEIGKIIELKLQYYKGLEQTRDLFIIGCYTGLRFSDFSQLRLENINNGLLKIRTQKNEDIVVIPLHEYVDYILKKYNNNLPKAYSNQKMNENLKNIGKLAKLDDDVEISKTKGGKRIKTYHKKFELITTHTARRSFATNLFLDGFPAISIMKITGHKTEKAFLKYIKITPEQNAELLRTFWNQSNIKPI